MGFQILGSTGKVAEVDTKKRLIVEATSIKEPAFWCREGRAFTVTTFDDGLLTTEASENAILFIKNTGSLSDFRVHRVFLTTGSTTLIARLYLGVTGTPSAQSTSGQIFSTRAGSSAQPSDILAEIWEESSGGISGLTLADGHIHYLWQGFVNISEDFGGSIILPPGGNLVISAIDTNTGEFGCSVELVEVPQ